MVQHDAVADLMEEVEGWASDSAWMELARSRLPLVAGKEVDGVAYVHGVIERGWQHRSADVRMQKAIQTLVEHRDALIERSVELPKGGDMAMTQIVLGSIPGLDGLRYAELATDHAAVCEAAYRVRMLRNMGMMTTQLMIRITRALRADLEYVTEWIRDMDQAWTEHCASSSFP
jgi:hypothetical protein